MTTSDRPSVRAAADGRGDASEIKALGKRPCPDCGGELEWEAARQLLACPYCGFVPREQPSRGESGGAIAELDLERGLAEVGQNGRGYGAPKVKVKCQSCHAISVFEPERVAQRCDFCGSPAIAPYEETRDPITPQSLLPVNLSATQVRDILKKWYGSRWLAPNRLRSAALTDTLHAIYLPYWTFDAHVDATWTAESGDYYWEQVQTVDAQGRGVTQQVQKVRWYASSGQVEHFFDDDLVPGTIGVRLELLRAVEPFPTDELAPYDPSFVRGWTVERYQVDLRKASDVSLEQMNQALYAMCSRQVPGDTHRNLQVNPLYTGRTFKHILVPVWLSTYTFGARAFQTLINGYTGQVAGDAPKSWVKVFFFIILPILLAVALFLWMQTQSR